MSSARFNEAIAIFTRINAEDPNTETVSGRNVPRALLHASRLTSWIERLDPNASEALRLAAHCQHLERWRFPRSEYPRGRRGYLQWRKNCAAAHSARAAEVLKELTYPESIIDQVSRINLKQGLGQLRDPQTMEDALCLAFLEHDALDFADGHEAEEVQRILRRIWGKMSQSARVLSLDASLPAPLRKMLAVLDENEPANEHR